MRHDDHAMTDMAGLVRLEELKDYKVASGFPDPRGWEVKSKDGRTVGEVKNLLVDRQAMRVRYLEVELDGSLASGQGDRRVHVPVASARLDDARDDVIVDMDALGLPALGVADTSRFDASHAAEPRHDDRNFFGSRAPAGHAAGSSAYLVLHDEQLNVGKREVSAGEVQLRKTVETEHVTQHVPLRHDEVTIERHPVSGAAAMNTAGMTIGEETIRVPLTAEEAVVEKRIVPTEEVVLRTEQVVEDRVVEGDVRHERLATEGLEGHVRGGATGLAGTTGGLGSSATTGHKGLGERLADKVDDMKDRVDGNPASRPGIDRTDDLNRRI